MSALHFACSDDAAINRELRLFVALTAGLELLERQPARGVERRLDRAAPRRLVSRDLRPSFPPALRTHARSASRSSARRSSFNLHAGRGLVTAEALEHVRTGRARRRGASPPARAPSRDRCPSSNPTTMTGRSKRVAKPPGDDADDAVVPAFARRRRWPDARAQPSLSISRDGLGEHRAPGSRRALADSCSMCAASRARLVVGLRRAGARARDPATPRRPGALRRGAMRNATSSPVSGVGASIFASSSSARTPGRLPCASTASPARTSARLSPSSGATSAMVPMATRSSHGAQVELAARAPRAPRRRPTARARTTPAPCTGSRTRAGAGSGTRAPAAARSGTRW